MIIVTGANGFIGSAIVWQLNQAGITEITCVDPIDLKERPQLLATKKYSHFLKSDELWDFLKLPSTKKDVTWIIHMGACSSTTETNEEYLKQNNTLYTQRLYEWCVENNKHLIYASSAATYGAGELGYDDETDPEKLRPLNLYGHSKVAFDRWLLKQPKSSIHWYGLKFFNVFGPNESFKGSMASVAFKAFHQIRQTKELGLFKSHNPDYADGKQMRDFVYVKDITRWIMELMEKTPQNGIYNMGYGQARTWLDLAHAVFKAMNLSPNIRWIEVPENIRNQYQYFTEAKMDKWKSQALSSPEWPLEKAVDDYIKNYLEKDALL